MESWYNILVALCWQPKEGLPGFIYMKNIRVLMFGWEFPPHNSGGLGTACYGLTKSLARTDVSITFVLPKKLDGYAHDFLISKLS